MIILILGEVQQPGKEEQMSGPWRQQAASPLVFIVTGFPHRAAPSAVVMTCMEIKTTEVTCFLSTVFTLYVEMCYTNFV